MNARLLLTLQLTSFMIMLITAENLFENNLTTALFATAFFTFARCSIYISKHSARLLRELDNEKRAHKAKG